MSKNYTLQQSPNTTGYPSPEFDKGAFDAAITQKGIRYIRNGLLRVLVEWMRVTRTHRVLIAGEPVIIILIPPR